MTTEILISEVEIIWMLMPSSARVRNIWLATPGGGDVADWWAQQRRAAASGDPAAARLRDDYGFLPDLIPAGTPASVRRAEATIARFAHLPDQAP